MSLTKHHKFGSTILASQLIQLNFSVFLQLIQQIVKMILPMKKYEFDIY